MKPVLNLNGEQISIKSLNYNDDDVLMFVTIGNGFDQDIFWNNQYRNLDPSCIDLENSIEWVDRHTPVHSKINDLIEEYNKQLCDLSLEIASDCVRTGYVNPDLSSKYTEMKQRIYGAFEIRKEIEKIINMR